GPAGGDGGPEQLAHAGGAVLRLLHAEHDQVEVAGIDAFRHRGPDGPGQLAGTQLDQPVAAFHRDADDDALAVDQVGAASAAYEGHVVTRERELRAEKRTV